MAIKRRQGNINVVEAAKARIKNVFDNDVPVYLSFSGGKDSLAIGHLVYSMIQAGEISADQLKVQFIDEEAIFPCIEKSVMDWRKRFILAGAKFEWFCLEVKHFNCFNALENDESFICWDRTKKDVWVRQPPPFAIRHHPLLKARQETYQDFLERENMNGITITGVRVYESVQRLTNIASTTSKGNSMTARKQIFPIYDWEDNDVWLYLLNNNIEIPEVYLYLWQIGTRKNNLRVSQFFSIDTARVLVRMNEYYPDLMDKVIQREPNAYLAALYWDSEMFRRNTRKRKELEGEKDKNINYKKELSSIFSNMEEHFDTKHKYQVAKSYRNFFLQFNSIMDEKDLRQMYEALLAGDPKRRTLRAMYNNVFSKYAKKAKEGEI